MQVWRQIVKSFRLKHNYTPGQFERLARSLTLFEITVEVSAGEGHDERFARMQAVEAEIEG